jgi:hypothetical protein
MDVLPIASAEVSAPDHDPAMAGLRAHLSAVYALTQTSPHLFASPLGPFAYDRRRAYVPRFVFFGSECPKESWRLAFLAGFDQRDTRSSRVVLTLIELLARMAEAAHGFHIAFFPVVDAAGLFLGAPHRALSAYHWGRNQIPELSLLEKDTRLHGYQGFVRIETGNPGEDVAVVQVNGSAFNQHDPDLEIVTSEDEEAMPVRFEAGPASKSPVAGPLTVADDLPHAPFELILRLPGSWAIGRCQQAATQFLLRFLWHYRAFQAYGQHL